MIINRGKTNEEIIRGYLEERAREKKEREGGENKGEETPPQTPATDIPSTQDFWTIGGVEYRGRIETVDLLKTLLDNRNPKTQDEWIEYSRSARARDDFYVGDFPLYHSLFTSLFRDRDGARKQEIEEIREFLKKQGFERWLMTLTRIAYQPASKNKNVEDMIIHNKGMIDEYQVRENFVYPDELVKDSTRPSNYKALLGTDNIQEINNVYNWLTSKDAYLWRVNSRSKKVDERVAGFVAVSDRSGLSCYRDASYRGDALGVRFVRKKI